MPLGADLADSHALECISCHTTYEVRDGIPRFVTGPNYSSSFGLQWNRFKQEQIDSRTGLDLSERRFFAETGWDPEWLQDKVILDLGSGAGRFLDIARRHARAVVGVDVSSAVDASQANLGSCDEVNLVQADLFDLPFKDGAFDVCYCIGVLQHTPSPLAAASEMSRVLANGGSVAVTVYERRQWTKYHSKYLLRRLTTRLSPTLLLRLVRAAMPVAFLLSDVLFRVPLLGRAFAFMVPVANYVHEPSLTRRQRYRWALLDTFDMLAPAYDQPLTEQELCGALAQAGLHVRRSSARGLNVTGSKRNPIVEGRSNQPDARMRTAEVVARPS